MKGKEVKIGLSVIGVLLCVFGAVLFNRLSHRDDDSAVAAKSGPKASDKKPQSPKKAVSNANSPDAGTKLGNTPHDGPSLKTGGSAKPKSPSFSSHDSGPAEPRDPWAVRNSSPDAGGRRQDATQEQEGRATDRYGRIEGRANDNSQYNDSSGAFAVERVESDLGDDMPTEAADPSDGGPEFETASEREMDQPADGYLTVEKATDAPMAVEAAGEDSFPPASRGAVANRGLPIGGPLKSSADEVQLTPIDESADEPLKASHDAEIAEAEAADQRMPQNFSPRSATGRHARPGFSSASRQTAAAGEPREQIDEPAAADDAAGAIGQSDFGLPEQRAGGDGVYFVETNDNFASISKKVYGTEGYFKALHEYNRERFPNPNLIDPGDEVATPDVAVLEQNYPNLCPKRRNLPSGPAEGAMRLASSAHSARGGRTYLVREGDTLFDIAKHELGKANRWREIYDLNQDQLGEDFNYLSPGTELLLPGSGEKPDPVADRRNLDRSNRRR